MAHQDLQISSEPEIQKTPGHYAPRTNVELSSQSQDALLDDLSPEFLAVALEELGNRVRAVKYEDRLITWQLYVCLQIDGT